MNDKEKLDLYKQALEEAVAFARLTLDGKTLSANLKAPKGFGTWINEVHEDMFPSLSRYLRSRESLLAGDIEVDSLAHTVKISLPGEESLTLTRELMEKWITEMGPPVPNKLEGSAAVYTPPTCKFDRAWIGPCNKPTNGGDFCTEHEGKECVSCGVQATRECSTAGQFVCGAPLCDDCTECGSGLGHRPKDLMKRPNR